MHLLYICGIDFEREAWHGHAVRGVRAAWDAIGHDDMKDQYRQARKIVDSFAENTHTCMLVATGEDETELDNAAERAVAASEGVLTLVLDPESLELEEAREASVVDGEDSNDEELLGDVYSASAYRTALAMLALSGGNPTVAFNRTYMMQRATEDTSLWAEVRAAFLSVFPLQDGPGFTIIG